jgi:hypothetical protein
MDREFLKHLERELAEKGKLIEAGWVGLRLAAIPETAGALQLDEMRMAFFAGAQHLFGSIMGGVLDPGDEEPTAADMRRMDNIHAELAAFLDEFQKKHGLKPQ